MLNISIEKAGGGQFVIIVGEDGVDLMQYTTSSPQRTVQGILKEYNIKGKRGVPPGTRRRPKPEDVLGLTIVDVSPN
jgi:hypothetical protein